MMPQAPVAFLSYARFDDEHENGRLTQFRERLSNEVRLHTGETFAIFQDRNDIAWGEQWKPRIEGALQSVTFFIPVLTPSPALGQEDGQSLSNREPRSANNQICAALEH